MRKYLWAGVAVLCVSAHASENPFDLEENFGKLDQDQEVLLGELRKLAEAKALAEEQELDDPTLEEAPEVEVSTPGSVQQMVESLTEVVEGGPVVSEQLSVVEGVAEVKEEVSNSKAVQDLVGSLIEEETLAAEESANTSSKEDIVEQEAKEKQVLLEKVRQKEAQLLEAKEKERQALEAKKEAERLEVIAYEKKRAEKLAEKKLAEVAALEKEALAQKAMQQKKQAMELAAKKEEAMQKEKAMQKVIDKPAVKEEKVALANESEDDSSSVADINVTRDKLEAKLAADKAYEEAVREMSQED